MPVETLALGAGKSVAKIVASRWLAGRASKEAAGTELIDLIKTGFPDEIMRRKTSRQFEAIADAVAERLLPYIRQELSGLDDGTREAAIAEVVRTLEAADLSDEALLADDVDPVRLARRVRAALPRREAEFQLGEVGSRLYEVLLAECCDCLAHTIVHLPEFTERAAAESLSRLSSAIASLESILARLPTRTLDAPEGDSLDDEFTRRYLTFVSANLDRLSLFGVRLNRLARARTTLSVAYISLNVTDEDQGKTRVRRQDPATIAEWREARSVGGTVRVEHALGRDRLILLRGEAGSGKSTLLRWLAISAARGEFAGDLAPLNGYVPFLVKLRSHAGQRLPSPPEFLDDISPELGRIAPDHWAHRQFQSGRALLLVDGIDEIVESQRHEVREWIGRLTRLYPDVRIVVTSRPSAAEADWLRDEGFRSAFLEPLSPADLRELIKHWHNAIRDGAAQDPGDLPCPPERLPAYEAKLLARLESAAHLQTLASTPLLAAMLCALNLDQESLPRDRVGLYAAAIEMLLDKRDSQRGIPSAKDTWLDPGQKIRILRELAWHLSISDRVELPTSTAQRLTADRLEAMPQARVSGEEALDALLRRSGIIREPVPGRIDFVHRTIQEYLTAEHAADIGDMDLLVRNAHLDQWRETIIMTAGHANEPQREELIHGLLRRAQHEQEIGRQLKLLAAGCLETLPSVSNALRTALDQCLRDLIPPQDDDEPRSLAAIGEPVLEWLPENLDGLSDDEARAAVRTAWLVNAPESLNVLRRYAADPRHEPQSELSMAWNYFDPVEYADRVLTALAPDGHLAVSSPAQLAMLAKLPPLSSLWVLCTGIEDYARLPQLATLRQLQVMDDRRLQSLDQLPPLGEVSLLSLRGSRLGHGALTALVAAAPKLDFLDLNHCGWVDDLTPLAALPDLTLLSIMGIAPGTDLSPLAQHKHLRVYIAHDQVVRGAEALGDRLVRG